MKTVILCGGQGTRIRDVSDSMPKPMIPVGNLPILWHIMRYYSVWGHKDFILCLGYKGDVIRRFFLEYRNQVNDITVDMSTGEVSMHGNNGDWLPDWVVTMAETGQKAMTGSRVRKSLRHLEGDEDFFLTYGDGLGDVDLDALLAFHKKHGKILTVTGVRPPGRFGEIRRDPKGQVTEFNEKPQAAEGLISGGFFVCRRELLDYLPEDEELVFEKEPMNDLVRDGQLMVYEHDGFWQPMDTARDHQLLNGLWERGEAPWKIW